MLAAQPDKALLHVYNFQKVRVSRPRIVFQEMTIGEQDQIALKMILPEKLTCLALDLKARYCAGGTAQGRIYLWEARFVSSFSVWPAS